MEDLVTFKAELSLIVNNLAKAVVTAIFAATENVSKKPETEERLRCLVDSLCVEAVDNILKVVEDAATCSGGAKEPPEPDGNDEDSGADGCDDAPQSQMPEVKAPRSSSDPPETDKISRGLLTSEEADDTVRGPTEQTYILVVGSAAVDSKRLLLNLQSRDHGDVNGVNETTGDTPTSECPTSSPALQADLADHEYARPSSLPPKAASAEEGGIFAARSERRRLSRHKKNNKVSETTESHLPCLQCRMLFPNAERLADHQRKSHPACSVCGALFTGILRLREHEIKEHGLLPYACDYCPKRFNHKAHRDLHVKARHTGEKTCHCDICGKGYSCISVLKTHRMTHFDKTFFCDVCGKGFYHACHLTRHKLVHQDVRPHKCATCGKGFTQATNLRSHQTTHTGERQLCSICGKTYRCLKNHLISKHAHELPANELPAADAIVTCHACGKTFPNQSQLKAHQRSHTGEKPFHCDVCGKNYRMKELLRDHRYTHTGEKPYSCKLCTKSFSLATSFTRHRSIHSGETPHSCHACGKDFRLLSFLKAHLQTKAHLKQVQQMNTGSAHS